MVRDRSIKGAYGSPRVTEEIRERGFPASKARVERLMRENGIRARHERRYPVTTDSKHKLPVAPNLLNREFTPAEPNQVFSSDITYIWTDEGWLYLAVVLDLFNREVVGWSIKPRVTVDLVTDALTMVWFRRGPAPGALCHSDRGSQNASHEFQRKLATYGLCCSMSRKGKLLGQRPDGKLLQQLEEQAGSRHALPDASGREGRSVRINRSVLQPQSSSFVSRLGFSGAVPSGLHQRSADQGCRCMTRDRW